MTSSGAGPRRYPQMGADDRALWLAGHEVYRFGGYELANRREATSLLYGFFTSCSRPLVGPNRARSGRRRQT
jgi:hypothetical protein